MLQVPEQTGRRFEAVMAAAEVAVQERWHYHKWLRYYLDFCGKYVRPPAEETSLGTFLEKLASKNQSAAQCDQAAQAVRLYIGMVGAPFQGAGGVEDAGPQSLPEHSRAMRLPSQAHTADITSSTQPQSGSLEAQDRRKPLGVREAPPPAAAPSSAADTFASPSSRPPEASGRDGCLATQPRIPKAAGSYRDIETDRIPSIRGCLSARFPASSAPPHPQNSCRGSRFLAISVKKNGAVLHSRRFAGKHPLSTLCASA